ncbi:MULTISPECIES: SMI1/KNR4 family protein [unclassified Nocardia]|uniref:SMI1/KNR4 family protein n=1 Tax=unclassified Nocardia TaxID=2637762 RepID=UPI0024A9F9A0|nr:MULTISPECIES: SMI1/KNR4 family protein [unclassified Nocardia]
MKERLTWPVLLGMAISTKGEMEQQGNYLGGVTLPREKAAELAVVDFERSIGEVLPSSYRSFLLHANGWEEFFYTMDLFGLPELLGRGKWRHASFLLQTYSDEGDLCDSGLEIDGLIPVAANQGRDLVVTVREGWPGAGATVWFDGGVIGRFSDFQEFFEHVVDMERAYLARGSSKP